MNNYKGQTSIEYIAMISLVTILIIITVSVLVITAGKSTSSVKTNNLILSAAHYWTANKTFIIDGTNVSEYILFLTEYPLNQTGGNATFFQFTKGVVNNPGFFEGDGVYGQNNPPGLISLGKTNGGYLYLFVIQNVSLSEPTLSTKPFGLEYEQNFYYESNSNLPITLTPYKNGILVPTYEINSPVLDLSPDGVPVTGITKVGSVSELGSNETFTESGLPSGTWNINVTTADYYNFSTGNLSTIKTSFSNTAGNSIIINYDGKTYLGTYTISNQTISGVVYTPVPNTGIIGQTSSQQIVFEKQ